MRFVGRKHELKLLEGHYCAKGASLIPIYGRRRVGKSRLIDEFVKGKPHIYFLGKRTTADLQLAEFKETAQRELQNEGLNYATFTDWQAALQTVTRLWKGEKKLVIVLDELQWTAEASPELPSVLQALWDTEWKKRGNIMIVLCGSHVGFMEREILAEKSPLFGRRSDQIKLGPLSYPEAARMLDHYSETARAEAYFLVGGVPAYLERFVAGRSIHQAITEEFCSELKFFALEPHFLIREELREPSRYFTILTILAEHRLRLRDLAKKSGIEARVLTKYLGTLLDLGYVSKAYPVRPGRINPQEMFYEVTDPLLCFWFRFIFPNLQLCRPGQEQSVFEQCIRPHLESYFGGRFEKLCQESLIHRYQKERLLWSQVGQYWDGEMQIDVAGIRRDHWIDLGECKWGAVKSLKQVVSALEAKIGKYPTPKDFSVGKHIFLRNASSQQFEGVKVHYLGNLFA